MSSPVHAAFTNAVLSCAMLLALAACHSDSSSSVRIQVNNSIDDENPNLIVDIVVRDDDDEDTGAAAAAQPAIIEAGTVGPVIEATDKGSLRAPQSAALAYLSLAAHGRPRGIAIADPAGQTVAWIASEAIDALSEPSWSLDGERLIFVGADGVHASERSPGAVHAWTEPVQIAALPDASASDGGPLLERQVDGELAVFGVILASAAAAPGAAEDVFALFSDARGEILGVQNLTRTPAVRELDASWSPDGLRIAALRRSTVDEIAVYDVFFDVQRDASARLSVSAELEPAAVALWDSGAGTLGDVSWARTRDLLAVSAWNGSDWDVLCLDLEGNAANLGVPGLDELAPSWSSDDRSLAVEQRCASDTCEPLALLVWELAYPAGPDSCPEVAGERRFAASAAAPAWRP